MVSVTSDTPLIFALHGRIGRSSDVVNEHSIVFDFWIHFFQENFLLGVYPSKTKDFRSFWFGLTDSAADWSAPC